MAKMTEAKLIKCDSKRNNGEEVLQAIRDIKAGRTGCVFHHQIRGQVKFLTSNK
jgi:putative transcriptional regulator